MEYMFLHLCKQMKKSMQKGMPKFDRASPPHPKTLGHFNQDDIWQEDGLDAKRFKARYWQKAGDIGDTCPKGREPDENIGIKAPRKSEQFRA